MIQAIRKEMKKTLIGKETAVEGLIIALLAGGHVLIEDLPGMGKTTMAKSFALALGASFNRIQFTPDLMPSDLIGVTIYDKGKGAFVFERGPIFNNIILADEINRTSPKTQSALLEAMEEAQVTMDGTTYVLEPPFMVIATENPIEQQGTFPLPEAQLDRFIMRISMGYPSREEEVSILTMKETLEAISPVINQEDILKAKEAVHQVYTDQALKQYIVDLCGATRHHEAVRLGASPRASVHLFNAAKAKAYIEKRDYVTAEDIRSLVGIVLAHRLLLKGDAIYRGMTPSRVVDEVLKSVSVPKVNR